jgi:inorganic pyrophosphatase
MKDISEVPKHMIDRLSHYFLTYKEMPFGDDRKECEITDIYGRQEACEVIERSVRDYNSRFNIDKRELFEMIRLGLKEKS